MLEVKKSLLFKEIAENRIDLALELLEKEPNLIFATTTKRKNLFHVLLEKGHSSSFLELFVFIKKQADRRILFTFTDSSNQNVLHYIALYGTPEIFKTTITDLWEEALSTATRVNDNGHTPIQLAQKNSSFQTSGPDLKISENDIFLMLEDAQVDLPWHEERLQLLYRKKLSPEVLPLEYFIDPAGSNILHTIAMHGNSSMAKATISSLGRRAKQLAIRPNNFGKIPLQLVDQNISGKKHKKEALRYELGKLTINLKPKTKPLNEKISDSLNLFSRMLCPNLINEQQKNAIFDEIILLSTHFTNCIELSSLVNHSEAFKKTPHINKGLIINLVVSIRLIKLISDLNLTSKTKEDFNCLEIEEKKRTSETIDFIRKRSNNHKAAIVLLWKLHSINISKSRNETVSAAIQYKKANCSENVFIAAKILELIQYDHPYVKISIKNGDHTLIGLSVDQQTELNKFDNYPLTAVLVDVHEGTFFPPCHATQKLKPRVYYPIYASNIACTYNPNYHQLNVGHFFSPHNRSKNPSFTSALNRLLAIYNLFSFLEKELSDLYRNQSIAYIIEKKMETIKNCQKELENRIAILHSDYTPGQVFNEQDIDQINLSINLYITALFRITQRPFLPSYPRNLFSHTHWNIKLQPLLAALKSVRQKLEIKLVELSNTWQTPIKPNQTPNVKDEHLLQAGNRVTF